ncbi:MAG TPA: Ig-like domain-containing protein [Gemmatimonadales bacterium]|jgi:uncharacterized protein YjdB
MLSPTTWRRALALAITTVVACNIPTRDSLNTDAPARVAVTPKLLTMQQNQTADFTAIGFTSAGDTADLSINWSVTSGSITDTSTNNGRHRGRYRAGADTGKVKVVARGGGKSDTAVVTVTLAGVATVVVTPSAASVAVGQTVQLQATPLDSGGNPLSGRVVTWASTNPGVASVNGTGVVSGLAPGVATVTASCEGQTSPAAITVTVVPVALVSVSPASANVIVGQTAQLTATPKDANGNPLSGRTVTWATSNPAVASVSGNGLVTGGATGTATITASSEGQNGTAAITVTLAPVASVSVSPASATVMMGQTVQLSAIPKDANGSPLTGRVVTWASSAPAVASVSAGGLVTGVAAGTATLTATSEGKSGTATVTVTSVPVASVAVSPGSPSIRVGGTVQLTATAKDSAGNVLTGRVVSWASSASGVASVSGSGLVTGVAAGTATLTATSEGKSGTATVTVTIAPVAAVTVAPASANVRIGGSVQLSATTKDSAGNVLTGRVVTWASSVPAVATVSASGLVTGVAAGSSTITATSEGKSGTSAVTVTVVPVASVAVSPSPASIQIGRTVQLSATTKDSAGNVLTGRVVTWASSAPAVATVSASGLVTGVAAGTATITATSEGKSGTAAVTVNPVPVASVTVSPASTSLVVGQTAQLSVTTKDSAGNVLTGRTIAWASSSTTIATVSATGSVTAKAAGSATITATSEGKSGTATIAVTVAPVASVAVSPSSASVAVGQTVQLTASPKDANGNPLTGRVVTWATSNAAVATVSSGGLVSGLVVGTATITATSEGQSGSSAITVTVAAAGCAAACRYVAVNGNDGNAGTKTAPWRTIQHAADVINPGDTVIVNDGVYTGGANVVTITRSGTAAAWMVFRAANRWGAIVDGQNNSSTTGFEINGNYIRVEGFEVRNTSRYAMETYGNREDIAGNHDVILIQNHLHDVGHICTGTTGGIVGVSAYSDNLTIERNVIHDIGRLGPGEQGCVEPNANWQNHDHGVYNGVGNNVVIRNNVFYNFTHGWAIQRYNGGGSVTTGLTIVNNTFGFPNPNRDAQIIIATTTNNIVIANNIFYQPKTAGVWFDGAGNGATLVGNISTNAIQTGGSALSMSGNLQNTDPLLVNATGFNFHLTAGSPARGLGVATWCPSVDFDGVARSGACSAGAYQN